MEKAQPGGIGFDMLWFGSGTGPVYTPFMSTPRGVAATYACPPEELVHIAAREVLRESFSVERARLREETGGNLDDPRWKESDLRYVDALIELHRAMHSH